MSSLKENQNKIPALEADIAELKDKINSSETKLRLSGVSELDILNALREDKQLLTEMTRQLNLLLEEKKDLRREQQTSAAAQVPAGVDLTSLSVALDGISKKLEFVTKEVVIQHRMRMDNWTESKRTKEEQEAFKEELLVFYQRQHPSDPKLVRCMVLDEFFPRHLVIASHIWKHCTHGEGLNEFGLQENDLNNPRNGILMCKEIEQAFDTKKLCFLVDRIHNTNLVIKVLDPVLLSPATSPLVISGHSLLKFRDIDGRPLQHPAGNLPFRRILDFHAKRSYQKAINRGWIAPSSSFDDFFDMSIGASIPDLHVYQTLFGDEARTEDTEHSK